MKVIQLNNTEYEIRTIATLNVKDYQLFIDMPEDDFDAFKHILRFLTDIPYSLIESIEEFAMYQVDFDGIIDYDLENNIKLKRNYDEYTLKDFENTSFSKWIDIDAYKEDMNMVIAILLSPEDTNYEGIMKIKEYIETMLMVDAYSIWYAFIKFRESIFKDFSYLFTAPVEDDNEEDEEEDEEENNVNQWLDIAYSLTNEDITKKDEILSKTIYEILNWMSFLKDKRDEEEHQAKQNN